MLPARLGNRAATSHRIWPWFHDKEQDVIYCQTTSSFFAYVLIVRSHTWTGNLHVLFGEASTVPTRVVPVSISLVMHDVIALRGQGSVFPKQQHTHTNFWDTLMQQGGSWMWTHVSNKGRDTKWLAKGLETGTAVILSNGLYSRKKGPHVCGAGWVIACCKARHVVKGSFYNFLRDASSY
jgi:hypothetical protein